MGVATPESKVKTFVRTFMKKEFPGIFYYSPPGGQFGQAGMPDHIYLWKGLLIAIEIKSDTGRLSDRQQLVLTQLANQGALCDVIYGKDVEAMTKLKDRINVEVIDRGTFSTIR